jgi:hypothetical protein
MIDSWIYIWLHRNQIEPVEQCVVVLIRLNFTEFGNATPIDTLYVVLGCFVQLIFGRPVAFLLLFRTGELPAIRSMNLAARRK